MKIIIVMEMTFGKAHDIWSRVVSGDKTLTADEVKSATEWFDEFCTKLGNKSSQSKQELDEAIQAEEKDTIEKKSNAAESDKRQLDDFIRKHDDLIGWLNKYK